MFFFFYKLSTSFAFVVQKNIFNFACAQTLQEFLGRLSLPRVETKPMKRCHISIFLHKNFDAASFHWLCLQYMWQTKTTQEFVQKPERVSACSNHQKNFKILIFKEKLCHKLVDTTYTSTMRQTKNTNSTPKPS